MIKTLGNVTLANKQAVRCDVVGSLVSTLREFKAICLLNGSSMLKPLLAPQVSYFQPGPEVIPSLNLPVRNLLSRECLGVLKGKLFLCGTIG